MRILFMGTPDFAVASLRRLVEAGTFPNPRDVEMFAASPYPYEQKF